MKSIYWMILEELRDRKCALWDIFPPIYICSIGAHLFNLYNAKSEILVQAGRVLDTRLHIMFVAPPGFSKSFFTEQFLRGKQAILIDSGIDIDFEQTMTESGYVGTIRFVNGESVQTPGAAYEHRFGIIGVEEFSALSEMMSSQHSRSLDVAMLSALDSGYVYKRLAAGRIEYRTFHTLWAGTQPMRFDLGSGFARRFIFINFVPERSHRELIKQMRREGLNVRYNMVRTAEIRKRIRELNLEKIEKVIFDKSIYETFDKFDIPHFEEILYERLLLGYTILAKPIEKILRVKFDEESFRIFVRALKWREQIRKGSQHMLIIQVLRENGGAMRVNQLRDNLLVFGIDYMQFHKMLNELVQMRVVKLVGEVVSLR